MGDGCDARLAVRGNDTFSEVITILGFTLVKRKGQNQRINKVRELCVVVLYFEMKSS